MDKRLFVWSISLVLRWGLNSKFSGSDIWPGSKTSFQTISLDRVSRDSKVIFEIFELIERFFSFTIQTLRPLMSNNNEINKTKANLCRTLRTHSWKFADVDYFIPIVIVLGFFLSICLHIAWKHLVEMLQSTHSAPLSLSPAGIPKWVHHDD